VASSVPKVFRNKRGNNLFDIAFQFQNYGVGLKVARSIWHRPDCYWTLTRVVPTNQVSEVTAIVYPSYQYCAGLAQTR
jgi:hypothetical protein